jgi:hypothetical protein
MGLWTPQGDLVAYLLAAAILARSAVQPAVVHYLFNSCLEQVFDPGK